MRNRGAATPVARRRRATQDSATPPDRRAVASGGGGAARRRRHDPDAADPHDGPRRRPRRAAPGLAQLPWRRLVNPFRPVEILSADQVEAIHRASLRILAEIGVEVLGDRASTRSPRAGAAVDRSTRRVRLDPGHVEALIATAPADVRAPRPQPGARHRASAATNLVFGAVGGPAFVSDLDRGRRAGNFADFVDYVRIIGALDVIHQEGGGPLEPNDLPGRDAPPRHVPDLRASSSTRRGSASASARGRSTTRSRSRCLIRGVDRDDARSASPR